MIQLEKTKMVLFDFDDTLCIHSDHRVPDDLDYSARVLKGEYAWTGCKKSTHMEKFMKLCERLGIQMGLISQTVSYQHMQLKHDWVLQNYNIDIGNYCVGTLENKLVVLKALAEAHGFENSEIMIVDDLYMTLDLADAEGFLTATPMEIVNYITDLYENT